MGAEYPVGLSVSHFSVWIQQDVSDFGERGGGGCRQRGGQGRHHEQDATGRAGGGLGYVYASSNYQSYLRLCGPAASWLICSTRYPTTPNVGRKHARYTISHVMFRRRLSGCEGADGVGSGATRNKSGQKEGDCQGSHATARAAAIGMAVVDIWRDAARHQKCGAFVKEARVLRLEWRKARVGRIAPGSGAPGTRAEDNATVGGQHGLGRGTLGQRKRFA